MWSIGLCMCVCVCMWSWPDPLHYSGLDSPLFTPVKFKKGYHNMQQCTVHWGLLVQLLIRVTSSVKSSSIWLLFLMQEQKMTMGYIAIEANYNFFGWVQYSREKPEVPEKRKKILLACTQTEVNYLFVCWGTRWKGGAEMRLDNSQ